MQFYQFFEQKGEIGQFAENFFNATHSVLTLQILSLVIASLEDYVKLFGTKTSETEFSDPKISFVVKLWLGTLNGENVIQFDPPLEDIGECLLEGLTFITKTIEILPKMSDAVFYAKQSLNPELLVGVSSKSLESIINYGTGDNDLHIKVERKLIQDSMETITKIVEKALAELHKFIEGYQIYKEILSNKIEEVIQQYNNENHPFEDYAEVNYY